MTRRTPHHKTEGMGGSPSQEDMRNGDQSEHWSNLGHNLKVGKAMRAVCQEAGKRWESGQGSKKRPIHMERDTGNLLRYIGYYYRSRILLLRWIEEETSWWRLESNKKSQNRLVEEEEPCKWAQSISKKLKFPIISLGVQLWDLYVCVTVAISNSIRFSFLSEFELTLAIRQANWTDTWWGV